MTDETTTETQTTTTEASTESLITPSPAPMDFTTGKPEGFPDDFWDEEKKAPKVDALFNAFNQQKTRAEGLRVKLSKGEFDGKAPEDIKEYTLELTDDLKPLVPEDDPIIATLRQSAKESGMPKDMFNKLLVPAIKKLAETKAELEKPPTPEEIEANRMQEVEKLGPSGSKIVEAVGSFIKQLEDGGTFSEAEAKTAREMAYSADAVRVLNKLRMMGGGRDQVPIDIPIDEKASRMDIENKMAKAMKENDEANYLKYSSMLARMNN